MPFLLKILTWSFTEGGHVVVYVCLVYWPLQKKKKKLFPVLSQHAFPSVFGLFFFLTSQPYAQLSLWLLLNCGTNFPASLTQKTWYFPLSILLLWVVLKIYILLALIFCFQTKMGMWHLSSDSILNYCV